MYRLITAYRAKGTVSSVEPRSKGRRKDTLVLDAKREKLIASTIHEIYLKPERPTMTYLIEQVRARCAQKGCRFQTAYARRPGLKLKRRGEDINCENTYGRYSHI